MSNKILNLVRDARIGDPTAKEVLKVIADQCNDRGSGVWSSYAYIAWCIERGRSTVIDKCKYLNKLGLIESQLRVGNTNLWTIDVDELESLGVPWRNKIENQDEQVVQSVDQGVQEPDQGSPEPGPDQSSPRTQAPTNPKEPTYVENDSDGVPKEWIMVYHDILDIWGKKFPDKRQPLKTNSKMQAKVKARMKAASFKTGLWAAILKAEKSPALQNDSWFQLEYLLRNDDNYEKVAAGEFDWKDGNTPQITHQHDEVVVQSRQMDQKDWKPPEGGSV